MKLKISCIILLISQLGYSQNTVIDSLKYFICEKIYTQKSDKETLLSPEDYPILEANILEAGAFLGRVVSSKDTTAIDSIIAFKPIYNTFLREAFGKKGDNNLLNRLPNEAFKFNFEMKFSIFSLRIEKIEDIEARFEQVIDFYIEILKKEEGYWQVASRYIRENAILFKPFILKSLSDWDFSKQESNIPYSTFLFASEEFDKREVHVHLIGRLPEFVNLEEKNDYSIVIIPRYLDFTEPNIISDLVNLFESINTDEKKIALLKKYDNLPLDFKKSKYAKATIRGYIKDSDDSEIKELLKTLIK